MTSSRRLLPLLIAATAASGITTALVVAKSEQVRPQGLITLRNLTATNTSSSSSSSGFSRQIERLQLLEGTFFAEGACRRAFKGRCYSSAGGIQDVVIKAFKPEDIDKYPYELEDSIRAQERAIELAQKFNAEMKGKCRVVFLPIRPCMLENQEVVAPDGTVLITKNQMVTVEPLLEGNYEKFSSNNGWVTNEVTVPGAFMHWTWHHTKNLVVSDLQGVQCGALPGREGTFMLTDPAICSLDEEFGSTDCGREGIANFFRCHRCSHLCEGFKEDRPAKVGRSPLDHLRRWTSGRHVGRVRQLVLGGDKSKRLSLSVNAKKSA